MKNWSVNSVWYKKQLLKQYKHNQAPRNRGFFIGINKMAFEFDKDDFIAVFPEFAEVPEARLDYVVELAEMFLQSACGCLKDTSPRYKTIIYQLIAHLLTLMSRGDTAGAVTSATEGSTSVGMQVMPLGNKAWWNLTGYGATAYMFIKKCQQPFLVTGC